MDHHDVIIVGAGPGGSTAALYLARAGARVLLVDKEVFPRDKACGDLLPDACLEILNDLGLSHELEALGCRRAQRVVFATEHERLFLDGRKFVCVPRRAFDHLLFASASQSVDTFQGARVEELLVSQGRVCGARAVTSDGQILERSARFTVGADGYSSLVARRLSREPQPERLALAVRGYWKGVPIPRDEAHFYYLSGCSPGYVWIFPVGDDLANVGLYMFASDYRGRGKSLRLRFENFLAQDPLSEWFRDAKPVEPLLSWSLPLAAEREPLHGPGFVLIGDAAGLVDPFWGHGIDSAMVSGRLAAQAIVRALKGDGDAERVALEGYTDAVFRHFESTWRTRVGLRSQIRSLSALLGSTPLEHFRRWLGNDGSLVTGASD